MIASLPIRLTLRDTSLLTKKIKDQFQIQTIPRILHLQMEICRTVQQVQVQRLQLINQKTLHKATSQVIHQRSNIRKTGKINSKKKLKKIQNSLLNYLALLRPIKDS